MPHRLKSRTACMRFALYNRPFRVTVTLFQRHAAHGLGKTVKTRRPTVLFIAALIAMPMCHPHKSFAKDQFDAEAPAHWAFQKVVRLAAPKVRSERWVR